MHDDSCPDGDAEEYQKNCIDSGALRVEVPQRHLQRKFPREDTALYEVRSGSQNSRGSRAKAQELCGLYGVAEKGQIHHVLQW